MDSNWILEHRGDPAALEKAYRDHPRNFTQALDLALHDQADDVLLRAWALRLEATGSSSPSWQALRPELMLGLALAVGCALLVRLPALWLDPEWFYPRFAPLLVVLGLGLWFWRKQGLRAWLRPVALVIVAIVFAALLPGQGDSVNMALIHLPLLAWALVGLTFNGANWRQVDARVDFLRYNGELLILGSLLALGGGVFSALTVALFQLSHPGAPEWYGNNLAPMGMAALPILATLAWELVFRRRTGIPPLLARIFTPLFLLMLGFYLPMSMLGGQNPFVDRDFLIIVNGLLLVVLGMSLLTIAERSSGPWSWMDSLRLALLSLVLLLDALALGAILFRLGSFGPSPNRVVVLGSNLLIFSHLIMLARAHWHFRRGSLAWEQVQTMAVSPLFSYAMWAASVSFLLPLIFRFA